jgi:hypothetical protein
MRFLRRVWQGWKRIAQRVGDAIARVVLTIFYFTVFAPFGLGLRLWGDPLQIRARHRTAWPERNTRDPGLDAARRLF